MFTAQFVKLLGPLFLHIFDLSRIRSLQTVIPAKSFVSAYLI